MSIPPSRPNSQNRPVGSKENDDQNHEEELSPKSEYVPQTNSGTNTSGKSLKDRFKGVKKVENATSTIKPVDNSKAEGSFGNPEES